jgi:deazaflavin-dependent oxidoreductase (nitroreductase family)
MPLSRTVARTNRYWVNPIARLVAGRIPPFLLLRHRGRRSGKPYTTPVWAFRHGGDLVIVLTYGPTTDWLRNLQAAGGGEGEYGGRRYHLDHLRVEHGSPLDQPLPWLIRHAVRLLGMRDFLHLAATPVSEGAP